MTLEQLLQIGTFLGLGGLGKTIIDLIVDGWRDTRRARGLHLDALDQARAESAWYAEQLQRTRELYLRSGGDPAQLGPIRYQPPTGN